MTWSIGRALVLTVALALPAWAASATDALVAEIGAALEKGDTAQATRLADGALGEKGLTPLQRGRLLLDRGLAHELDGASDAALIDFTAALQTRALPADERAQALLQRGFLLDGLGKLDDAAKDYGAVIALKTAVTATALNNRANIYRRQNRLDEARRDYLAALQAGSEHAQYPWYGLGQIAEAHHDGDAARGFYTKALATDPGYSLAADRLAALGGPPDATLVEPDKIVLHPPGTTPPAPAPAEQQAPAQQKVALHPPKPRPVRAAPAAASPPGLGLRPALDGPATQSSLEVQLGAWRSEPEAQAGWEKARSKASAALHGLSAHIVMADLPGKGRYFRLRVATSNPQRLCQALQDAGISCLPARN